MSGKVINTLAATQPNYHLASGLTLVRTSGRACSRTPSQIAQRCWIQAKMVQIRVAFTPEMGREGAVAPRLVRSFVLLVIKPRQGIHRTHFCLLVRPPRLKISYISLFNSKNPKSGVVPDHYRDLGAERTDFGATEESNAEDLRGYCVFRGVYFFDTRKTKKKVHFLTIYIPKSPPQVN